MFDTMRIIASKPRANRSGEDGNIIEGAFSELGIQLKTEDLKIISEVELKNLANKRLFSPLRGWGGLSAAARLQVSPKAGR